MLDHQQPRRHARFRTKIRCAVLLEKKDGFFPADIVEISASGVGLLTHRPISGGKEVVVIFAAPGTNGQSSDREVKFIARVVHEYISNSLFKSGLEILKFSSGEDLYTEKLMMQVGKF